MSFDLNLFESTPVLGIIRDVKLNCLHGVVEACLGGGLSYLEITQNTPDYIQYIQIINNEYPQVVVGAGTILSVVDAQKAFDAGAKFLVAPDFNENVSEFCVDKKLSYFIQVNLGDEEQKSGISERNVESFLNYCKDEKNLNVIGLMIIPPNDSNPSEYFKKLKDLNSSLGLSELSMGMSSDYIEAVKYNSTYLRIGSAILGERK